MITAEVASSMDRRIRDTPLNPSLGKAQKAKRARRTICDIRTLGVWMGIYMLVAGLTQARLGRPTPPPPQYRTNPRVDPYFNRNSC